MRPASGFPPAPEAPAPIASHQMSSELSVSVSSLAPRALRALAEIAPQAVATELAARADSFRPAECDAILRDLAATPWGRTPDGRIALATLLQQLGPATSGASLAAILPILYAGSELDAAVLDALARHPAEPALLRLAVQTATRSGDAEAAHRWMTALGTVDPSPGTVQALHRQRKALDSDRAPDLRVALLSSSTVDLLAAYLDLELRKVGLQPALYLAPFNAITLEVLHPGSGLYAASPNLVFLSAALDDLVPELASTTARTELETKGREAVAALISQVRTLLERTSATVVVHSLHSPTIGSSPLDWRLDGRGHWVRDLNTELQEAFASERRVHILDVAHVAALRHEGRYENPKMRYMASMRYGEGFVPALAAAYARYAIPLKGLTKKCLVLDCDNTLWGGIVGEDGPTGIRLGNTSPGIEYHDFQLAIQALAKRGIILAVNSKNNPDDALEVIRSHPWMVLREEAFSALRINWTSKVENLKSIAEELNIGIDSLVFMDDNPVECEQVRQMLPQVVTVQMPKDPSRYRETLESLPWFESFAVTAEDLQRVEQYRANRSREALKSTTQSVEDYLGSLNITVGIRPIAAETLARCVQLVNRTNQFNLTTRRYTAEEIERMLASDAWHTFTLSARDKFGDHGLVGLALVERSTYAWRIDTLLMSCRVLGQGIEQSLLATIHAAAVADGARALEGAFIPTKKNAQVRDLYPRFGFSAVDSAEDGAATYRLALPSTLAVPSWITVER